MNFGEILNSDYVYTPVYHSQGHDFVVPIPSNVYPSEKEALKKAVGGGLNYMLNLDASFTGRTVRLDDNGIAHHNDGLSIRNEDFYVIVISGPIYEKAKQMSEEGDFFDMSLSKDIQEWLGINEN